MSEISRKVIYTSPSKKIHINSWYSDEKYQVKAICPDCIDSKTFTIDKSVGTCPICYIKSHEEINYYSDTDTHIILLSITTYGESRTNGIFIKSLDSYSLRHGPDGIPVLLHKGRIVCKRKTVERVFNFISRDTLKLFSKTVKCSYYNQISSSVYYVLRNPKLFKMFSDISKLIALYTNYSPVSLRNRRNINRYLLKGDVKNALRWYLGGYHFPEKVSKYLLEEKPYIPEQYSFLYEFLKYRSEKELLHLIKNVSSYFIKHIIPILQYGYDAPLDENDFNSNLSSVVLRIDVLKGFGVEKKIPRIRNNNLKIFFEEVNWLYFYFRDSGLDSKTVYASNLKNTSQSTFNFFKSDVKIRHSFNPYELILFSRKTSINLEHLVVPLLFEQLNVFLIEKNRKYLGYIKVTGSIIVEARTVEDQDLSYDPELQAIVLDWIETFNLSVFTEEITGVPYLKTEFSYSPISTEIVDELKNLVCPYGTWESPF